MDAKFNLIFHDIVACGKNRVIHKDRHSGINKSKAAVEKSVTAMS